MATVTDSSSSKKPTKKFRKKAEQFKIATFDQLMSGCGVDEPTEFDRLRVRIDDKSSVFFVLARRVRVGEMEEFEAVPRDEKSAAQKQILVNKIVDENGDPMFDEETIEELDHNTGLAIAMALAKFANRAASVKA